MPATSAGMTGGELGAISPTPPHFAMRLLSNSEPFEPAPYWKVIMSVRVSVGAFGFRGTFVRLPLP